MKMRSKRWAEAVTRVFLWLLVPAVAAAMQLPPEIQADRYLLEAEKEIQEKDFEGAKAAMDRILALQAQHGLELPEQFFFRYAEVLDRLGLYDEAVEFVTKYLTLAGRDGEHYREALELLSAAEDNPREQSPEEKNGLIQPLFGVGIVRRGDDHIDFKELEKDGVSHLLIENDSRRRLTGLVGIAFYPKRKILGGFAAIDFVDGIPGAIDGLVVGANVKIMKRVGVAVGYGLHNQKELSHGFRRQAERNFPYRGLGGDTRNYDGIPLEINGKRYFPGSPIVGSTNQSVFIGLTFSIDPQKFIQQEELK